MPFFVTFDTQHRCVMARIEGKLTPSLVAKMAGEVRNLFARHGCRLIVNDLRGAKMSGSEASLRTMAEALDCQLPRDSKRALVVEQKNERHEFFETACFNRGHLVRFFTDLETARAWLRGG